MESGRQKVTRKDVAREAGVSETIVSYVLNKNRYVKEEKRQRVLEVVEKLQYHPNNIARALHGKGSLQILFLAEELSSGYFSELVSQMSRDAYRRGYMISLCESQEEDEFVSQILSRQFDGLFVSASGVTDRELKLLVKSGIPMVLFLNREISCDLRDTVVVDTGLYRRPAMSDVSRFRSAINGFNRTDVVNYVESISVEHQKQLRQLQNELAQLRAENGTLSAEKDALTEKVGELEAALDAAKTALAAEQEARKQAEDEALELLERVPAEEAPEDDTEPEAETPETEPDSELAAYRRAALTEQNAAARARRLQAHVSALCDNARSRYQDTGEEISALSVDLTTGIERLQDALAELQLIFDQSEDAFEALELPDEDA